MNEVTVLPELKQIVGAILFAAKKPVTAGEILGVLRNTAAEYGGATEDFAELKKKDIETILRELKSELTGRHLGFNMVEVAGGYRLENDVGCGPWLRQYLQKGKSQRLSRPALETLAIIAYRQPCTRSEVEAVRGVAVDQIVRNLMEMQLVKVSGRSELPGRPWLFGTTQKFLEHFGISKVDELPGVEELRKMDEKRVQAAEQQELAEQGSGADAEAEAELDLAEAPAEDPGPAAAEPGETEEKRIDLAPAEDELDDKDEFDDDDDDFDEDDEDEYVD